MLLKQASAAIFLSMLVGSILGQNVSSNSNLSVWPPSDLCNSRYDLTQGNRVMAELQRRGITCGEKSSSLQEVEKPTSQVVTSKSNLSVWPPSDLCNSRYDLTQGNRVMAELQRRGITCVDTSKKTTSDIYNNQNDEKCIRLGLVRGTRDFELCLRALNK